MLSERFICDKHQLGASAQGGVLFEDDLVYVGHVHTLKAPTAYRGWLVVEPKRHVAELGDLDEAEASAVGRVSSQVARLLQEREGAEHVYLSSSVTGYPICTSIWPLAIRDTSNIGELT